MTDQLPQAERPRSLWQAILARLAEVRDNIAALFQRPDPVDSVAFSIAFIALAAKLAKADGHVTSDEVSVFRRIFHIPPEEEANAARVYNLCRQDTAGFEAYAAQMARILGEGPRAEEVKADVLDGLFHIAVADGEFHPGEEAFLREVHRIFGLPDRLFTELLARHVPDAWNPWQVLGLEPGASRDEIRRAWRRKVRESHPDQMIARGLPEDMVQLANARVADLNRAYEALTR